MRVGMDSWPESGDVFVDAGHAPYGRRHAIRVCGQAVLTWTNSLHYVLPSQTLILSPLLWL